MQREIQAVYQISQSVGRLSDLEETLELLTAEIKRLVTFDSCVIYLTDLQNQQLSPRYATGVYSDVLGRLQVKMGMGIPGWVAAHKRSLIHVSPEGDFKDSELVVGDLKSCLAVPVSIDRHVVGVICLYSASLGAYQNKHLNPHSPYGARKLLPLIYVTLYN